MMSCLHYLIYMVGSDVNLDRVNLLLLRRLNKDPSIRYAFRYI